MVRTELIEEAKTFLRTAKAIVVTSYTLDLHRGDDNVEAFVYKVGKNEIFIEVLKDYGKRRGWHLVVADAKTGKVQPWSEPYYPEVRGYDEQMFLDISNALYEN